MDKRPHFSFIVDELPAVCQAIFPLSDKREDNFVAGLSMGGRGTCVLAFNHPEKFAAACVLSAVPSDLYAMKDQGGFMWARMAKSIANFDGDEQAFLDSYQNTFKVLKEKAHTGELPRLMFACGEADGLYQSFLDFKKAAGEIGLEAEFYSVPNLRHEWRFWDLAIQKALTFFGLDRDEASGNPF